MGSGGGQECRRPGEWFQRRGPGEAVAKAEGSGRGYREDRCTAEREVNQALLQALGEG